jgi:hypothetical protein
VFVAVKMEEALDLAYDLGRWQVLCKAPFLNTNDSRVAARLADGQWAWYYRSALRTVIQACGRVVRAPDDEGATYVADSSILDLFERARGDMPPWFRDQVDRMSTPDLPPADPDAALGETTTSVEQVETVGAPDGDSGSGGASGGSSSSAGSDSASGAPVGRTTDYSSGGDDDERDSQGSPVADVWDTDD